VSAEATFAALDAPPERVFPRDLLELLAQAAGER
jgi:hypothetical protein